MTTVLQYCQKIMIFFYSLRASMSPEPEALHIIRRIISIYSLFSSVDMEVSTPETSHDQVTQNAPQRGPIMMSTAVLMCPFNTRTNNGFRSVFVQRNNSKNVARAEPAVVMTPCSYFRHCQNQRGKLRFGEYSLHHVKFVASANLRKNV